MQRDQRRGYKPPGVADGTRLVVGVADFRLLIARLLLPRSQCRQDAHATHRIRTAFSPDDSDNVHRSQRHL